MDHEEMRSLIPAYALGAVPQEEVAIIRDHILSCDSCMAEADRFADVTSSLALAIEPVELPAGFADRVVQLATPSDLTVVHHPAPRSLWSRLGIVTAAATTAAALILALLFVDARLDLNDQREIVAAVAGQGIPLTGDDAAGKVADLADGSVFAVSGLEPAPGGKTYQLWLMKGTDCPSPTPSACEIVSAGTFQVDDGVAIIELDETASSWDHSAVTIEDDGGVEAPTSLPVISSFSA